MESQQTDQTPEEVQQETRYRESVDEEGNFKSLGHQQKYYGELPNIPPDGPSPYHYTVDQGDQFKEDVSIHRQKSAVREGVREALTPQLDQLPDDEQADLRKEAEEWKKNYMEKAEEAEKNGNLTEAKKWRDISRYKEKDLEALGPSKREQVAGELKSNITARAITLLGEARMDNDPVWNHPKMAHDAGVEIGRFNQNPRSKILLLPQEESPWGEVKPIKPSNMVFFELPEATLKEARRFIYSDPDADPRALFKKAWQFLHQSGYAHDAKPTFTKQGGQ